MDFSIVQGQLATIADALMDSPASTRIAIRENKTTVQVVQEDNGWFSWFGRGIATVVRSAYNLSPIAYFYGQSTPMPAVPLESGRATADYFQRVFGKTRICRIDNKLGIHLTMKRNAEDYFCRADVEKIFLGSSEVTWDDLEELFKEIKDHSIKNVRFLSEIETNLLRSYFADVEKLSKSKISKRDIDILFWILSPFYRVEHIFLNKLPGSRSFTAMLLGESPVEEMKKRVLSYESIRHLKHNNTKWALVLAKELAGRSPPPRVMIPHHDGYLLNFHMISGGGEMKYLLKSVASSFVPSYVLYAGTRPGDRASRAENFRAEIAAKGPQVTKIETSAYLNDPKKGFVITSTERVAAIGFSQGGVHAQRGAILFSPKFSRIVTVCAPGIEKAAALLYAQHLQKNGKKVEITHIVEPDDQVSEFGEARLGLQCSQALACVSFGVLTSGKKINATWKRLPSPNSCLAVLAKMVGNVFSGAHLRPILGRELDFSTVLLNSRPNDQAALNEHLLLSHDQKISWEEVRKKMLKWRLFRVSESLPSFMKVCES